MAETSLNTTSAVEEIELYPEPESNGKKILRTNQSAVTVVSQILHGMELRERKPQTYRRKDRCPAIIDIPKPHNVGKRKAGKVLSNSCTGCSHWTIPQCSKSMMALATSTKKTRLKIRIKAESKTICPMRIAELAMPTKRHCIDTWRHKSYLLPEYMVERLKQHVLDQRPVVQIPEAVYCFQRRKSRIHNKKPAQDALIYWKNQMDIPLCKQNTKILCLLFAQKIIQRLLTPLKITINSDFENISKVVVCDLVRVTKGKKYMRAAYLQKYRKVHADFINKITVWIVGILEDLEYKQLEEDLRELEEEEGPVLDFLDDLLENVFNICVPQYLEAYIEEESEKSISSDSMTGEHTDDELSDTEYFKNKICNLLNNVTVGVMDDNKSETAQDLDDISNKDDLLSEINVLLNNILKETVASNHTINEDNGIVTDIEYFENEIINLISIACKESGDTIENINNDIILAFEDSIEDAQLTKTQSFEIEFKGSVDTVSEDTDDRSKKVMFSVLDIVTPSDDAFSSEITNIPGAPKESIKFYNNYIRPNTFFAEPNENLLSDADEIWPNRNFSSDVLRPSESVTKYITSLGKFTEDDETNLEPSVIDSSLNELENVDTLFLKNEERQLVTSPVALTESVLNEKKYIKIIDTPLVTSHEILITLKDSASLMKCEDEKLLTTEEIKIIDTQLVKSNEMLITLKDSTSLMKCETQQIKMSTTYKLTLLNKDVQVNPFCRDNESQTVEIKILDVNLGISKIIITSVDPQPISNKSDSENIIHPSKKVTLKATKTEGTVTDTFENKLTPDRKLTKSMKLSQCDIHKWCYDLGKGFKNLEIWQNWLQNTCKETNYLLLKNQHQTCISRNSMKVWKKLKNDVKEDAVLWSKINQNTHKTFTRYQKIYRNKRIEEPNSTAMCFCKINARKAL